MSLIRPQYDAFGNLNEVTRTYPDQTVETRTIDVIPTTNRLSSASYDAAGNMTEWNGVDYTYDALHRLKQVDSGQASWFHLYTAGGERIWSIFEPGNLLQPLAETFSLRGPSGSLLRRFSVSSGLGSETWSWASDQVFGGGGLMASVHPDGQSESVRHYHSDHLGSPRLVTDAQAQKLFGHSFLPYGEEVTDASQSDSPFRFTGHERDFQFATSMDDQDYMHARYYTPHLGRFGRVDPLRGSPSAVPPQYSSADWFIAGGWFLSGCRPHPRHKYSANVEVVSDPLVRCSRAGAGQGRALSP